MSVKCFAAFKPKQPLKEFSYDLHALASQEITIKVTHCGICHSDIHLVDGDWGTKHFPIVPGHEVIGIVEDLGQGVRHLKAGDRVGIGWQSGSCMECEWCLKGEENLCVASTATCRGHFGGFGERMQTDSRFAFIIPKDIDSAGAAPLLCGGITVYSPLKRLVDVPNVKVGVIGVGGLGHLAIQFASALGYEVTAFSSTPGKEKEVKALGAKNFVSSVNVTELKKKKSAFDFILSTVNVGMHWEDYLGALRPNGKLCVVGVAPGSLGVTANALIPDQKMVIGSVIGSRKLIKEMLGFAAQHNIKAQVEVMALKDVNLAIKKVKQNKARYRMVLEI